MDVKKGRHCPINKGRMVMVMKYLILINLSGNKDFLCSTFFNCFILSYIHLFLPSTLCPILVSIGKHTTLFPDGIAFNCYLYKIKYNIIKTKTNLPLINSSMVEEDVGSVSLSAPKEVDKQAEVIRLCR